MWRTQQVVAIRPRVISVAASLVLAAAAAWGGHPGRGPSD